MSVKRKGDSIVREEARPLKKQRRLTFEEISGEEEERPKFVPPTVVRLQRKKGIVVQDCDVYIGRCINRGGWNLNKSKWSNVNGRCVADYKKMIRATPELLASLHELEGKRLGCWCKPKECHGDGLVELFREVVMRDVKKRTSTL